MKNIIKAIFLSVICSLIVYSTTSSILTTVVVLLVTFLILFANEIINEQKFKRNETTINNCNQMIKNQNKSIRDLERLLTYRSELDLGLIHFDGNGKVLYCNEYFVQNVYGEEIDYYLQIKDYNVYKAIYDVFNGKNTINNIRIGEKYFAIKQKVVEKERKIKSVTIQFYDVTKTETLDKLHQSFLVDASHELNNPLSSIIMASEIIERENPSEFTDILVKESHRMKNVIHSIIEHSKLQVSSFEMKELNLSELCNSYQSIYKNKNVDFILNIEDDIVMDGNLDLIDRMLKNLIDNAFKYTDKGSVTLKLFKQSGNIICEVIDTGIGIAPENTKYIFDRFYREDNSRSRETGGSGIGLAIVKEIASVHNIIINVYCAEGQGCIFKLSI